VRAVHRGSTRAAMRARVRPRTCACRYVATSCSFQPHHHGLTALRNSVGERFAGPISAMAPPNDAVFFCFLFFFVAAAKMHGRLLPMTSVPLASLHQQAVPLSRADECCLCPDLSYKRTAALVCAAIGALVLPVASATWGGEGQDGRYIYIGYTDTHTNTHTHKYAHTLTHVSMYMCVYIFIYIYMYICIYIHTQHMYLCMYVCMHLRIHVHIYI